MIKTVFVGKGFAKEKWARGALRPMGATSASSHHKLSLLSGVGLPKCGPPIREKTVNGWLSANGLINLGMGKSLLLRAISFLSGWNEMACNTKKHNIVN